MLECGHTLFILDSTMLIKTGNKVLMKSYTGFLYQGEFMEENL